MADSAQSEQPRTALAWKPQAGPQHAYVTCPIYETCFGGARGGGKTDGSLGDWAIHSGRYGKTARGILVRKTYTALQDTLERASEIYGPLGAVWRDKEGLWRFPNKSFIRFRYLRRDADADQYQGHSYTRVYVEELTQFPDPAPINKMRATLRSATGIPTGFRATCNPGGPGHTWVKARYIDPAPGGWQILTDEDGLQRVFIPSRLEHNAILMQNDPTYATRLRQSGSEALVKAWLTGDWDIVEGAYFDCWSPQMVLRPFEIPREWPVIVSMDWGSARPFSVGWWAIATDDYAHDNQLIPRGAMVRFQEWYGKESANVGLKLTAEQVRDGILERTKCQVDDWVADPAIFAEDGGPSIAERMEPIYWRKADNKRVARDGAMGGWDQLRSRMVGLDGAPMIYVFRTCADSIRTIPALQHDPLRPEDVDTSAEDHAADEWRYAAMSRPWIADETTTKPPRERRYRTGQAGGADWMTA